MNADLWSMVGDAGQPQGFPAQIEWQRDSRIEEVATMSSEQQLDERFIQRLFSLKYEYRPDIRDRAAPVSTTCAATREFWAF